jgi:hypothetical protein
MLFSGHMLVQPSEIEKVTAGAFGGVAGKKSIVQKGSQESVDAASALCPCAILVERFA